MSTSGKPGRQVGRELRAALIAMVRKRIPESEVEDVVHQALAEAIESPHAPTDRESWRRWVFGVAKNKVVDYHRRAGRETFDLPDIEGAPAPHAEADLLRWAERHLPQGAENKKTLEWMLREGEGEKLESIAASEDVPPPRVRQRVSRLRRHFKENWQREVALLAAVGVIVSVVLLLGHRKAPPAPITHEVVDPRAEPMRRLALGRCAESEWAACLEGLDAARQLDPGGDFRPDVQGAREAAERGKQEPPVVPLQPPAPFFKAPSLGPTSQPSVTPAPDPAKPMMSKPSPKISSDLTQSGPPDSARKTIPSPSKGGGTK